MADRFVVASLCFVFSACTIAMLGFEKLIAPSKPMGTQEN